MELTETDWDFEPHWIKGPSFVLEFRLEVRIFDSVPVLSRLIESLSNET